MTKHFTSSISFRRPSFERDLIRLGHKAYKMISLYSSCHTSHSGIVILYGPNRLKESSQSFHIKKRKANIAFITGDDHLKNQNKGIRRKVDNATCFKSFRILLEENKKLKSRIGDLENLFKAWNLKETISPGEVNVGMFPAISRGKINSYRELWNNDYKLTLGLALASLQSSSSETRRELEMSGSAAHLLNDKMPSDEKPSDIEKEDRGIHFIENESFDLSEVDFSSNRFNLCSDECSALTMEDFQWSELLMKENAAALGSWDAIVKGVDRKVEESFFCEKESTDSEKCHEGKHASKIFMFKDDYFVPKQDPVMLDEQTVCKTLSLFCPVQICLKKTRRKSLASF